jgi:hypothetical protein
MRKRRNKIEENNIKYFLMYPPFNFQPVMEFLAKCLPVPGDLYGFRDLWKMPNKTGDPMGQSRPLPRWFQYSWSNAQRVANGPKMFYKDLQNSQGIY